VLELLEELRRDLGVALLVVTHDLGVARHIADDVAIMYRGEVVEQGPAADVFAHPAHPYTEGLLAAIPSTEPGRLAPKLRGEPPSPIGRIQGCPFRSRCPYAQQVCVTDAPALARVGTQFSACHFRDAILAGQAESLERA
jgi:oligopeptide/dipeptide ABC transporter ATP-binding protein